MRKAGAIAVVAVLYVAVLLATGWAEETFTGPAYQPPKCTATICPMYGPGGILSHWTMAVMLANIAKKPLVVPAGKTCASACALAIGFALGRGYDVRIAPSALFIPHAVEVMNKPMLPAFRRKLLAGKPFHWRQ